MITFNNDWDNLISSQFNTPYYKKLRQFLISEYKTYKIYPQVNDIFTAFKLTPYSKTKVLILGQDPYHQPNQAHGLAFSVKYGTKIPPSLNNILKEIANDLGHKMPICGNLSYWALQGVLLLNTVLTVREGIPNSHINMGWEVFTDYIISLLNKSINPIVFLLWGSKAINKKHLITNQNHLILTCPHPSPLSASRGFFGCKHFSKTNIFLLNNNIEKIDWRIPYFKEVN